MKEGCCTETEITQSSTIVMVPGGHRYEVTVVFCKKCGSKKATSSIGQIKK